MCGIVRCNGRGGGGGDGGIVGCHCGGGFVRCHCIGAGGVSGFVWCICGGGGVGGKFGNVGVIVVVMIVWYCSVSCWCWVR